MILVAVGLLVRWRLRPTAHATKQAQQPTVVVTAIVQPPAGHGAQPPPPRPFSNGQPKTLEERNALLRERLQIFEQLKRLHELLQGTSDPALRQYASALIASYDASQMDMYRRMMRHIHH